MSEIHPSPLVTQAYECAHAANTAFDRLARTKAILSRITDGTPLPPGETMERIQEQHTAYSKEFAHLQEAAGFLFSGIPDTPRSQQAEQPIFDYGSPRRDVKEVFDFCNWKGLAISVSGNFARVVLEQAYGRKGGLPNTFPIGHLEEKVRHWTEGRALPHGVGEATVAFCVDFLNRAYLPAEDQLVYVPKKKGEIGDIDTETFAKECMPEDIAISGRTVSLVTKEAVAHYGGLVVENGHILAYSSLFSAIAKAAGVPIPRGEGIRMVSDDIAYLGPRKGAGHYWAVTPEAFVKALTDELHPLFRERPSPGSSLKAREIAKRYAADLNRALTAEQPEA